MLKEFNLSPAVVALDCQALTITSPFNTLSLSSAWLKDWQQRIEQEWPRVRAMLQDKALMQVMLEGESALVLLPLLMVQQHEVSLHALYSNNIVFSARDW